MKYTCWTEISSIGKFGTVLPGMGASTYKRKIKKKWQNKKNISEKKCQKIYIYIYIYRERERENSISRYKLYAKTIRSITYKVIK